MIRMILCIDRMINQVDMTFITSQLFERLQFQCTSATSNLGPSPLPAVQDQLSLRSAIFDPYAVPKWLPWVYMHEVLWQGDLGNSPMCDQWNDAWYLAYCIFMTNEYVKFHDFGLCNEPSLWKSWSYDCSNFQHDSYDAGNVEWIGGHLSILHKKTPLFRSNITPQCRIQLSEQVLVEGEAVDLLRRCGKMCLGQTHHSDGGHHILGKMVLWILVCF